MIAVVLLLLFVGAAALAAWLAVSRGSLDARYRQLQLRSEEIAQDRDRLADLDVLLASARMADERSLDLSSQHRRARRPPPR